MLVLVIGGSASGKSEYAERRCMELSSEKKFYIATMDSPDAESDMRIARHRRLRAGKGFETLECQTHLETAEIPAGATALLECMSNLVANELFSPEGRGNPEVSGQGESNRKKADAEADRPDFEDAMTELVLHGVERLRERAEHTVIVTNQVFSDKMSYDMKTERYMRILARINNGIAALADEVVEVVCGIPVVLK